MRDSRSASQILYGFLPHQTVDLQGDVWRVREWRNALRILNIDDDTLRREILRQLQPWEITQKDSYLARNLRRGDPIAVLEVNPENGVDVEPFPKQWLCRGCKKLFNSPASACSCGAKKLSSFHFVAYHDECGLLREVPLPKPCSEHRQISVRFPGASTASELRFECPVCKKVLRKGFPQQMACSCGKPGFLSFNVHRAAAVFTPRTVVIVNAPRADQRRAIAESGGRARALSWVLDGMVGRVTETVATEESLRLGLKSQGLPPSVIEMLITEARLKGGLASEACVQLAATVKEDAESQAVTIALASLNSRTSVKDLLERCSVESSLGQTYSFDYPRAISNSGLCAVDLIDRFPILSGVFGYTRGEYSPGKSTLIPFRNSTTGINVYADFAETEALFFRLDPLRVARWLETRGWKLSPFEDAKSARLAILERCGMPASMDVDHSISQDLFKLIHSFAHRTMRISAKFAGIDRSALAELLVPLHLGFFIYATPRGDFVLGGLQAVFESRLHSLLDSVLADEHRCAMDPGCEKGGGACAACLHVGEPSCRSFNQLLGRETLFGTHGYLRRTHRTE